MINKSTTKKIQIGDKVGDWEILSNPMRFQDKSYRSILVRCKCGNEQYISFPSLYQKTSTKCLSCSKKEKKQLRDLPTGTQYGEWTVTGESFIEGKTTFIPVACSCGYKTNLNKGSLINPKSSMCCSSCASFKGVGDLAGAYITEMKRSAKDRGLEFNIDTQYIWDLLISQNFKCALTGESITVSKNWRKYEFTASLDRIDSTKGYIPGNVQWVHKIINRLKSNFPEHVLHFWVEKMYLYKKSLEI